MKTKIKLTFFGDSICVGQGVSVNRIWVNQVAECLDKTFAEYNFEVLVANPSVNGRTSRQALEDMPYHVQNNGVDILLVQFGLNDCNYWQSDCGVPRVSLESYVANIEEIYRRAKIFGAKYVILNTNHPTTRCRNNLVGSRNTFEDSNDEYSNALRHKFANYSDDLKLVDINNLFKLNCNVAFDLKDMLLEDELHLSEKGHKKYFEILFPILSEKVLMVAKSKYLL